MYKFKKGGRMETHNGRFYIHVDPWSMSVGRDLQIRPDVEHDFTNMPYADNAFKMVVFDPPHLHKLGKNSWLAKKYGKLLPTWELDIKVGFDECMRVLDTNGVLIFKWNESEIKVSDVLKLIPYKPLFGHTTGRQAKTIWMAFIKTQTP